MFDGLTSLCKDRNMWRNEGKRMMLIDSTQRTCKYIRWLEVLGVGEASDKVKKGRFLVYPSGASWRGSNCCRRYFCTALSQADFSS